MAAGMTRACILIVMLVFGGCGGAQLGTTPVGWRSPGAYADAVPEANREIEAPVYFATDRQATKSKAPSSRYGSKRATTLTLAEARVRIGKDGWTWDQLAARTEAGKKLPLEVLSIREFGVLPSTVPVRAGAEPPIIEDGAAAFCASINAALEAGGEPVITVFVHGFNTSFEDAMMFASSLWHHSARRGVVVAYSWPCHDHPFAYPTDRESGGLTARGLREFLLMLAEETDAERINVFTYSAGAPTVVAALHQMRLIFADELADEIQDTTKIEEVVFAGADLDVDSLRIAGLDRTQDVAERVTIYTSRIDVGVGLSTMFYFEGARLGRAERRLTPEQREALRDNAETQVIDVTRAQRKAGRGDIWGHGYWYGNSWVANDLLQLLVTGADPAERGLVRAEDDGVWRFPVDYPARASAVHRSATAPPLPLQATTATSAADE